MDGSHFDTRYPVVLRFEGFGPESLAGYEKHRKRIGGDVGHILKNPPTENRLLIGSEIGGPRLSPRLRRSRRRILPPSWRRSKNATARKISGSGWLRDRTILGVRRGTVRCAKSS